MVLPWLVVAALVVAGGYFLREAFRKNQTAGYSLYAGVAAALALFAGTFIVACILISDVSLVAYVVFWTAEVIMAAVAVFGTQKIVRGAVYAFAATLVLTVFLGTMPKAGTTTVALPVNDHQVVNVAVLSSVAVQDVPEAQACDQPHYYAYDAPQGSHNFGPAMAADSAAAAAQRFVEKAPCDPLWFATIVKYFDAGMNFSQTDTVHLAQSFANSPTTWSQAIRDLGNEIVDFDLVDSGNVRYATIGMIPGANPSIMPDLTQFTTQPVLGQALVVKLKNGVQRLLRLACDEQPAEQQFPAIPKASVPEVPPTVPPTTRTVTSSTTPPSTTSTTPGTSTVTTTTTPPVTTTTTTPGTSTTTSTTPSTTTTTPSTTSTTTRTTTTTPSTTTTTPETTSPKGPVIYPTGKPTVTVTGSPETTAPTETHPANPSTTPGGEVTGITAPGATTQTTPRVIPTTQPGGPSTEGPAPNPDGNSLMGVIMVGGLLGGASLRRKLLAKRIV